MKWIRFAMGRSCRWGSFVHFLQQLFKAIDVLRPEGAVVRDPVDGRLHPARLHPVVDTAPLAPAVHQAGVFQSGEVLRDSKIARRLGSASAWKILSSTTAALCIH